MRSFTSGRADWASLSATSGRSGLETGWRSWPPNSTDYFEALYASAKGGAILVCLNWRLAAPELEGYVDLTGDANLLFIDSAYARRLGFAGPLVPGSLLGGMISFLLGTRLPRQGRNYLKQRLEFLSPVYTDQELVAAVEVVRLQAEKQLVNLATTCRNPAGGVVCRGEALVLVSDVGERQEM